MPSKLSMPKAIPFFFFFYSCNLYSGWADVVKKDSFANTWKSWIKGIKKFGQNELQLPLLLFLQGSFILLGFWLCCNWNCPAGWCELGKSTALPSSKLSQWIGEGSIKNFQVGWQNILHMHLNSSNKQNNFGIKIQGRQNFQLFLTHQAPVG